MKKNIGNSLALYPTPLVVVGTMVEGKPNWVLVGHIGIIGHDRVMVSLAGAHYSNRGIKETKKLSINIVDEALLPLADRAGCVSGAKEDKSDLFDYTVGDTGAPLMTAAWMTSMRRKASRVLSVRLITPLRRRGCSRRRIRSITGY